MKNKRLIILFLLLVFVSGCMALKSITVTQTQNKISNIKEDIPVFNLGSKASLKFHNEIHEHLEFPILKLGQNEESAYPCKLTWTKSGNENWKVSKINDMKNHEK